jgi:HK97 family phage major capsid protein
MSEKLSQKADLALSNLTADGGLLDAEQNDTFIRKLLDSPTLIREIRTVPMNAPEMKINKIGFGSRILKAAVQAGGANDSGSNDRYVLEADRSKPTTSQVALATKEIIAEVRIPYEVIEDNIERGNITSTILALIAERAALDLEELIILGDTASGDAYLALQNGVLKLATSHVVNNLSAGPSPDMFNTVKKGLPTKYRRNLGALRFYFSMDVESDYRLVVSNRATGLGDATLLGNQPLPVMGIPLQGVALMPNASGLLTVPQNIIFGIQRNIRIEQDRDIRSREVVIVLTCRVAIQIEEEDAVVKVTNVA